MSDFRCFLGVFSFSAGITDTEGIRRQTACDHETPIFQRFHAPRKMFTAVVSRPMRQSEAVPPPTISDRETPAPSVTAAPPTVCTDHGPLTTDHSPQRSPDPAASPTAGLRIQEDATNEASAPLRVERESPDPSVPDGLRPISRDNRQRTLDERSHQPRRIRRGAAGGRPGQARLAPVGRTLHGLSYPGGCNQPKATAARSRRRPAGRESRLASEDDAHLLTRYDRKTPGGLIAEGRSGWWRSRRDVRTFLGRRGSTCADPDMIVCGGDVGPSREP
jgi:hypothetical protein